MKKMVCIALAGLGLVAFVGADVVKSSFGSVRSAVRGALTADVPLQNQLAEAQAQVDGYAENIIRGEVAAENLRDMIGGVEREVRALAVRVERERGALAALRKDLSPRNVAVPAALRAVAPAGEERQVLRRVQTFQAAHELLARREADLERLKAEYAATQQALGQARGEQVRLSEEIHVLAAELESLGARKAAARTRSAVGDATISASGFRQAQDQITQIRTKLREQNKLLQYYEYERVVRTDAALTGAPELTVSDPVSAIDEALAAYPAR